ncbi:hypothetical protein SBADM41S_11104 [Streptomyces badius]
MISAGPCGQSVATTGSPPRIASTIVIPKDSRSDVTAAIDPLSHSASMGLAEPIRNTWLCRPSSSTRERSSACSFPVASPAP